MVLQKIKGEFDMRTPIITIFVFCVLIISIGLAIYDYKKHGMHDRSIDLSRSDADALKGAIKTADSEFYQGEYEKAIAKYEKALRYSPRDAYLRNNLGTAYYHQGLESMDTPLKEEEFGFGVEIDARKLKGSVPLEKVKDALKGVKSNIVTAVVGDVAAKKLIENYALSLKYFVHVEEELDEENNREFWITIITGKTKDAFLKAEKELMTAIDIKSVKDTFGRRYSGYSAASRNLGTLYFRMGRKKDAVVQWERALQLEPTDAELRELLGKYK
jgi:tetratricopeptide (TPR) repeat protein